MSLPGQRWDLRMEEKVIIAVDNRRILFEQSLYTYRDHTLLATTGSFCNNKEEGGFKRGAI